MASIADLAARFDAALAKVPGRFAELAARFAAAAEINLGIVSLRAARPRPGRPDPLLTLHSLLDVLVRSAAATPTLLVCDEFSGITRVDGASAMLRTHLQHHFQELGIVFAGSEPSMMRMLFGDQAQPFYAQADLVEIPAAQRCRGGRPRPFRVPRHRAPPRAGRRPRSPRSSTGIPNGRCSARRGVATRRPWRRSHGGDVARRARRRARRDRARSRAPVFRVAGRRADGAACPGLGRLDLRNCGGRARPVHRGGCTRPPPTRRSWPPHRARRPLRHRRSGLRRLDQPPLPV